MLTRHAACEAENAVTIRPNACRAILYMSCLMLNHWHQVRAQPFAFEIYIKFVEFSGYHRQENTISHPLQSTFSFNFLFCLLLSGEKKKNIDGTTLFSVIINSSAVYNSPEHMSHITCHMCCDNTVIFHGSNLSHADIPLT